MRSPRCVLVQRLRDGFETNPTDWPVVFLVKPFVSGGRRIPYPRVYRPSSTLSRKLDGLAILSAPLLLVPHSFGLVVARPSQLVTGRDLNFLHGIGRFISAARWVESDRIACGSNDGDQVVLYVPAGDGVLSVLL